MSNLMTLSQGPPVQAAPKRRWFLRPWFIIPAILVVVAAVVVTVLVSLPQTITLRGSVIDRLRPDLGVAAAALNADGTTARTGVTGAFTMAGVPLNARVLVSAPNYQAAKVTASTTKMTIRLTPIPVRVLVTSAMTGDPVKAAISATPGKPQVYAIASGGTLRVYRAGAGESLMVAADGYQPAHAVVSTSRMLTVSLEPTRPTLWHQLNTWYHQGEYAKMVKWVLRPATGYTFLPITAQQQAKANKTVSPEFEVYATWRGMGGTSDWVFVSIAKPGATANLRQYVEERQGHAARLTITGYRAWHGGPSPRYGDYATMMQVGPFVLEVYGYSLVETDPIMAKIVSTLLGPETAGPSVQGPASIKSWTVPDPVLADMFPDVPGFSWGQMKAADVKKVVKVHYADLGNRVRGADIRYAISGGKTVAVVSVLALAPAYATPKAADAELTRLADRAAEMHGLSFENNLSGHRVMTFITNGMHNWYWFSGKTIIAVNTREGNTLGDQFVRLYAARTQ